MDPIIMIEARAASRERTRHAEARPLTLATAPDTPARPPRVTRPLRLLVAVIAMALLFAGAMTSPAEARPSVGSMNGSVTMCMEINGDPYIIEWGDQMFFFCFFDNGTYWEEYWGE